jgi:hypothetical protein
VDIIGLIRSAPLIDLGLLLSLSAFLFLGVVQGAIRRLLAFGIIFLVASVAASITIQGFYKRTDLSVEHPVVEDALGGLLGLAQGIVVITMAVIIFNSYTLPAPHSGDVTPVRDAQNLVIHESHIAGGMRDVLAPTFIHLLSPLLPSDLVAIFP